METLRRSWDLTKQSVAVAADNPELLMFPALSVFILFILDGPVFPQVIRILAKPSPSGYGLLLVLYCASDFVIIFFNSALMAAVAMHLDGEDATVVDGLRAAARWIVEILAWSLIAGTVGLAIQVLEERLGKSRRLIGNVVEAAWSVATFFVIPVIIFEGQSDLQALRRSTELFQRQWGTEVAGRLGLSAVFFVMGLAALMVSALMATVGLGAALIVAGMSFLLLYLLHEAAEGVFVVALYRYATTGAVVGGFTPAQMQTAFMPKDRGWTDVDITGRGAAEHRLGTWRDFQRRLGSDGGTGGQSSESEPSS